MVAPGPWLMLMNQCFKSMPSIPGVGEAHMRGGGIVSPIPR